MNKKNLNRYYFILLLRYILKVQLKESLLLNNRHIPVYYWCLSYLLKQTVLNNILEDYDNDLYIILSTDIIRNIFNILH